MPRQYQCERKHIENNEYPLTEILSVRTRQEILLYSVAPDHLAARQ